VIGPQHTPVVHALYGIRIRTPWPVKGVRVTDGPWDVEFVEGDEDRLANAASYVPDEQSSSWSQYAALPDGSHYRRWADLFEFLVTPDARRIHARTLTAVEDEAMLAYLLVDALSFSMVRLGWEPLHATAVDTTSGLVAFLGNSGAGKSTLAAAFVQGRARLVTDDMLILTRAGSGWLAQSGPPRIKLFRTMSRHIFGSDRGGIPMNAVTEKLIIPLDAQQMTETPRAVAGLYILGDVEHNRTQSPVIQQLSPASAFPKLLANTAGHYPSEPERLSRQLQFASRLVSDVPVKTLSYRRNTDEIFLVRDAVLADLERSTETAG